MAGGLAQAQGSSDAWPGMGSQAEIALNGGWILDQAVTSTGGFQTNSSPSSSSSYFFSTGDATAYYVHGRPFRAIQAGVTSYGEIISSSCDATPTQTRVTVGNWRNSTGLSTGLLTSVAVGPQYPSTGGNGNGLADYGTQVLINSWGM